MMNKIRFQLAAVMMLAGLTACPSVFAGEGSHWQRRDEARHQMMQEVVRKLGLSEDQMERIDAVRSRSREQDAAYRQEKGRRKAALKEELSRPKVRMDRIDALIEEISQLKAEKLRHRVAALLEIREILSPAQFEEFQKQMEQAHEN